MRLKIYDETDGSLIEELELLDISITHEDRARSPREVLWGFNSPISTTVDVAVRDIPQLVCRPLTSLGKQTLIISNGGNESRSIRHCLVCNYSNFGGSQVCLQWKSYDSLQIIMPKMPERQNPKIRWQEVGF
jgi:hypothetical protein